MRSLIIGIGIIVAILTASFASETPATVRLPIDTSAPTPSDEDIAIEKAKKLFKERKLAGVSMADGPCLSEEIIPDWSVDVVYYPRVDTDDDGQNQCQLYLEGKTQHIVELDQDGNLIRTL